jgi:hypothetical protein
MEEWVMGIKAMKRFEVRDGGLAKSTERVRDRSKGLEVLGENHKLMVQLDVTGRMARKEIAEQCGIDVKYMNRLLREDPLVIEYRRRLREEIEAESKNIRLAAENKIAESSLTFVQTLVDIASDASKNENARVSAARFGLQFAGMKLENQDNADLRTPHLAIRDGVKKEEEQKKTG